MSIHCTNDRDYDWLSDLAIDVVAAANGRRFQDAWPAVTAHLRQVYARGIVDGEAKAAAAVRQFFRPPHQDTQASVQREYEDERQFGWVDDQQLMHTRGGY